MKTWESKIRERLWKYIWINLKTGCWEWTGCKDKDGYGKTNYTFLGKTWHTRAHRLSMFIYKGFDITSKYEVLHICDNPPCLNPHHLKIGTKSDNMKDMIRKGRGKNQFE